MKSKRKTGAKERPPAAAKAALPQSPTPPRRSRKDTLLCALLLAAATIALYEPTLQNGFVNIDDPNYITENAHVRDGLSWPGVAWAFTTTAEANWHPLTWISHMADVRAFGLKPAGHHAVSVLWHALNVVLLFLLLEAATGYRMRSAVVAALFALCPLNVESVAWAAERKSLLCTAFLFGAFLAYGWYVRRPGARRYLAVMALFALGLLSKPMIVTLPFALLLADYWPLERLAVPGRNAPGKPAFGTPLWKLAVEKIPLFVMSAASAIITLYAQRGAIGTITALPVNVRLKNAVFSCLAYLLRAFWPSRLAVFYPYPYPLHQLGVWKVAAAGIILLGITALVWVYRERRYLLAGWLWYLGTLVPVIGLVQVGHQAMADRYAYIPFLGLFVMVVWTAADWAAKIRWRRHLIAATAVAALAAYAWITHVQIGYWRDSYMLFSHALEVTTDNAAAENNLGVALMDMGRSDEALSHFEASVRDAPDFANPHYNLAVLFEKTGRLNEAVNEYRLAIRYAPTPEKEAEGYNSLGKLLVRMTRFPEAISAFSEAIRHNPNAADNYLARGLLEYRAGSLDAAQDDLAHKARIAPSPVTSFLLGGVFEDKGELQAAEAAYEDALRMSPGTKIYEVRLEQVRKKLGQ